MNINRYLILFLILILPSTSYGNDRTVQSCNREITFSEIPQRAVSHDVNMTEMMLALGLQDHMIGYTGVEKNNKNTEDLARYTHELPSISRDAPSVELLLSLNADFFFAGWNYGLKMGSPLTPSTLQEFNIPVYELSESCIHIMKKPSNGFKDIYRDLSYLGIIFSQEEKAAALIKDFQTQISSLEVLEESRPKVFVFDSGFDRPFTAGGYAMPDSMIKAAGGENIFSNIQSSWTSVNWEAVIEENPEAIIIVDYGNISAEQKIAFLQNDATLSQIKAVKDKRFLVLSYNEATPGIQAIKATRKIFDFLH